MPFNTKDGRISASDVDECLYAVAQDDVDALSRLYDLTGGAIYAYALSITKNAYDAEDVTHDVYVKAYENAHSYASQGKPMAWLMTIAKNLCYTRFRKQIVIMHSMTGLKHRDIARILELPLATVISKYNRAIKKLQRIFGKGEL